MAENEFGLEDAEAFSFAKGRASDLLDTIFRKYKSNWDSDLDLMVDELAKDLAVFVKPEKAKDFNWRMKNILERALDLQRIFTKSRSFFVSKMVSKDAKIDEEEMVVQYWKAEGPEGNFELDIRISPMMVKIGTADGWDFHQSRVIGKAWVTASPILE